MKAINTPTKIKWETPNFFRLSSSTVKSGQAYFPGIETTMNAIAPTGTMATICAQIGNPIFNFTPNAGAICAGTATSCAGPGIGGFSFTAGPLVTSACGNVGTQMDTYLYASWGSDLCAATTNFNYKISVNFCSVC